MKSPIRRVSKNVGMNPVARAVAMKELHRSITDAKIAMHLLDHGQSCVDMFGHLPVMVRATLIALDAESDTVDYRKLRSGDVVVREMVRRGTWDKADLVTMTSALDIVLKRWPYVPPVEASRALANAVRGLHHD